MSQEQNEKPLRYYAITLGTLTPLLLLPAMLVPENGVSLVTQALRIAGVAGIPLLLLPLLSFSLIFYFANYPIKSWFFIAISCLGVFGIAALIILLGPTAIAASIAMLTFSFWLTIIKLTCAVALLFTGFDFCCTKFVFAIVEERCWESLLSTLGRSLLFGLFSAPLVAIGLLIGSTTLLVSLASSTIIVPAVLFITLCAFSIMVGVGIQKISTFCDRRLQKFYKGWKKDYTDEFDQILSNEEQSLVRKSPWWSPFTYTYTYSPKQNVSQTSSSQSEEEEEEEEIGAWTTVCSS